jgi:hypothetical protein
MYMPLSNSPHARKLAAVFPYLQIINSACVQRTRQRRNIWALIGTNGSVSHDFLVTTTSHSVFLISDVVDSTTPV